MQSLLIEHASRKRMYNQGFVDNVVMALRKDGTNELFLLANQQALPDLDAVKYLERKAEVEIEIPHANTGGSTQKKPDDLRLEIAGIVVVGLIFLFVAIRIPALLGVFTKRHYARQFGGNTKRGNK